jgi:SpoIID/LytB domain protein
VRGVPARALVAPALFAALLAGCAPLPPPRPVTSPGQPPHGRLQLAGEPRLDIGLAWDLDSIAVDPQGGAALRLQMGSGGAHNDRIDGPIRVATRGGGAAQVLRADGSPWADLHGADTLWVGDPADVRARLGWNGHLWRGAFKVFLNPRGRLTLAARVPLETYLLGVVPGEIGQLAPALVQAGRAQAIAARSYTLFYLGRRATEGFDLYGTVEDQVYGPSETERPLATQVVQSTRGMVALSGGWPIRANYCSTCGGVTAEVWEAWPQSGVSYLVSQRDAGGSGDWCASSPQFRWRETWTAQEFTDDLARYAPERGVVLPATGIGQLVDVRVASRTRSGRVWRLVVVTTTGQIEVPAYALRQVLRRGGHPESILRSNLFKIDVRRDPANGRAIGVVASGAGSGHGVGLCQTGALGMARAGVAAERIVAHYYPGMELGRLY